MLNVGSLFSGIGGFDLGLERTGGFRTAWFCEQDPYCQRVLAHQWPGVPCYPDITALSGSAVEPVDVLCGGFPCQDLSVAGKGAGLDGARSGLWSEYARLIGELRPSYVVVENVSALLVRGFERVLGDLAALGYDAEWDCIPASAVGAPHRRDRIWVVAYPSQPRLEGRPASQPAASTRADGGRARPDDMADADSLASSPPRQHGGQRGAGDGPEPLDGTLGCGGGLRDYWAVEPDVGRVADGVPARVDRLRSLGNALVPQVAEWIGRRIAAYEEGCVIS